MYDERVHYVVYFEIFNLQTWKKIQISRNHMHQMWISELSCYVLHLNLDSTGDCYL